MIDKQALLEHMNGKIESFRREYGAISDQLRQEKLLGEIKILEFYVEEIEKGRFDAAPGAPAPTARRDAKRKADIGEEIKIASNMCNHGFEIGQIVKVVPFETFVPESEGDVEAKSLDGKVTWYVAYGDYVALEQKIQG